MLGVTAVGAWHMFSAAWVSEQSHKTVVISTSEELAVMRPANAVDVGAISALGIDALDVPAEFDGGSGPNNWFGVGLSRWVLLTVGHGPEEKFVSTAI